MIDFKTRLDDIKNKLKLNALVAEKAGILKEMEAPGFWDQQDATSKSQRLSEIDTIIEPVSVIEHSLEDYQAMESLLSDDPENAELLKDKSQYEKTLTKQLDKLELHTYLSGRYDHLDAILSIHAGAGGTEAMDWTEMLERMYLRFAEREGWGYDILEETRGEEAGIKSVTIEFKGKNAYGLLKREAGTHRLVRQSPFNADNLRQTSFTLVEVTPSLVDDDNQIEVRDDELEWQFFRSGGHGGQNVNKVSTAVRLKHLPSGLTIVSTQERYQERNREIALARLKAKLWELEEIKKKAALSESKGIHQIASFGSQIRSYVLHPYKLVKDLRTEYETSNAEGVLDGDLMPFINAELKLLI
ncbi:MAG: peptide chain release factor 2 [bacterium]